MEAHQRGCDNAVKRLFLLVLCCHLGFAPPAAGYSRYADDNPFVEAMLRMMEIFGLIDRDRLPLGVPYLPDYGQSLGPGLGGLTGLGGYPGLGSWSAWSTPFAVGGIPGAQPFPGSGIWQGGAGPPGVPPGYRSSPGWPGSPGGIRPTGHLDGIWETNKGGLVIIRGNAARLYIARDRFQDFTLGYDRHYLWWAPRAGGGSSRYRYQLRSGRMVLRDREGSYLLLRRRR